MFDEQEAEREGEDLAGQQGPQAAGAVGVLTGALRGHSAADDDNDDSDSDDDSSSDDSSSDDSGSDDDTGSDDDSDSDDDS